MAQNIRLGCPVCGTSRPGRMFALRPDGAYDAEARPPRFEQYLYTSGGRGRMSVEKAPIPLPFAYGLRDALRTALMQLEQEIVDAGGELTE
jgi:hypothetical protein